MAANTDRHIHQHMQAKRADKQAHIKGIQI